jgi:outer membrane protein W
MRKLLMLVAAFAVLAVPLASNAQVSLGLRLGYGVPMGEAQKNADLSDGVKGQIPFQLDAMYHLTPNVSAGAYFSYGFAQVGGDLDAICDQDGVDCSARALRLGVQGVYNFKPGAKLDPWVGLGIGYEWAKLNAELGDQEASMTFSGFEFATLQAGANYLVTSQFSVGPFISLGMGRYSDLSTDGAFEATIEEKSIHEWLQFGFRGQFDL